MRLLSFRRLLAVCLLTVAAIVVPSAGRAAGTTLVGTVGPGFAINLTDNGVPVSHIDPGTYTIVVHDLSDLHNFHLLGPGVDQATDLTGTGDTTWTVTFVTGRYHFLCDAHPTQMNKSFVSGTLPVVPKLTGSVGPARAISLKTSTGARVKTLTPGAFKVAVTDRSKKDNFHLVGAGVNKKTGVKFRGKASWSVNLAVGKYRYYSDAHKKLGGSFVVVAKPLPSS